jgi:5'-phosphate synthase pdxT subunit
VTSGRIRRIGVLALQGAFGLHARVLRALGAEPREIRTPGQLAEVDGLVLPGGESTTISMLLDTSGLRDALAERVTAGLPVLGTCAGMILLAADVLDGRADQRSLGAIDIAVRRNAFGRQVDSFETELAVTGIADAGRPFPAVFIRAPVVERAGAGVEILACVDGRPVLCRQEGVLAAAFHPELSGDNRIHELFLREV